MSMKMSMKNCNYMEVFIIILCVVIMMIIVIGYYKQNNRKVKENYYDIDIKNDYIRLLEKKRAGQSDNSVLLSNYIESSKTYQTNLNNIDNKITDAENQLYILKNGNDNNRYTIKPSHNHLYINSMSYYA